MEVYCFVECVKFVKRAVSKVLIIVLSFALLLIGLVSAEPVWAHGGGTPVLTRVETGPYWVYVFTEPAQPQAGNEYHVTIAVTQPQEGGSETAVADATIDVRFVPESGEPYSVIAESSIAGPGYYEADTRLPDGGLWTVQIEVASPLGSGNAEYQVMAMASSGGIAWGWIIAGIVLILAGIGLFVYAFSVRKVKDDGASDLEGSPVGETK